ncbi:hypothetical protein Lal_00032776 [Lupinus albus]|nr:hypothetical protein Lal_00032776 [Lupinus albus]
MVVVFRVAEPATGDMLTDAQKRELEGLKLNDLKAKNYLFQVIDRLILETILCKDTSKHIWDSMKKKYQGTTRAKRHQALCLEFEILRMNRSDRGRGRSRCQNREVMNNNDRGNQQRNHHQESQFQGRDRERGGHHSTTYRSKSVDKSNVECFRCHSIFLGCNGKGSPQVHGVLEAAIIHTINTMWYCKNMWRFENKKISLMQAQLRIKLATLLSGNHSKLLTNNSVDNFVILHEFKVRQNFQEAPRIREVIWPAPIVGWIKINSDGAAHVAPGLAGGGCIFRDYNGNFKGDFADFYGIKNSLFAELKAPIMAIEIAYRKGWRDIWLECDSTLVVDIFSGKGRIPWKLANMWHTHVFNEIQSYSHL